MRELYFLVEEFKSEHEPVNPPIELPKNENDGSQGDDLGEPESPSQPLSMQEQEEEKLVGRQSVDVEKNLQQIERIEEEDAENQMRRLSLPQLNAVFLKCVKMASGQGYTVSSRWHEGLSNEP